MKAKLIVLILPLLLIGAVMAEDTTYKPFVLASINDAGLEEQTQATIGALESAGFVLSGQYAPLDNARVIIATSEDLQAIAANTERGGYAAGQRISVTERDGKTEVAFINPLYIQYAYRLDGDMQGVYDQLSEALGNMGSYGADKK